MTNLYDSKIIVVYVIFRNAIKEDTRRIFIFFSFPFILLFFFFFIVRVFRCGECIVHRRMRGHKRTEAVTHCA